MPRFHFPEDIIIAVDRATAITTYKSQVRLLKNSTEEVEEERKRKKRAQGEELYRVADLLLRSDAEIEHFQLALDKEATDDLLDTLDKADPGYRALHE